MPDLCRFAPQKCICVFFLTIFLLCGCVLSNQTPDTLTPCFFSEMNYYWLQYFIFGFISQQVQFQADKSQAVSTMFIIQHWSALRSIGHIPQSPRFSESSGSNFVWFCSAPSVKHGRRTTIDISKGSINFIKLKMFLLQVDLLATVRHAYQELVKLKELEEKIFSLSFTSYFH